MELLVVVVVVGSTVNIHRRLPEFGGVVERCDVLRSAFWCESPRVNKVLDLKLDHIAVSDGYSNTRLELTISKTLAR